MKHCHRCGYRKPISEFYKNGARPDGIGVYCKGCENSVAAPRRLSDAGRKKARKNALRRRVRLIVKMGGRCVCCGEDRYEFLQFDHKDRDGASHRRQLKRKNLNPSDIVRYGLDRFQILCANCNFARGAYGECPYAGRHDTPAFSAAKLLESVDPSVLQLSLTH